MSWEQIKLGDLFEQYRIQHIVQDDKNYGQITISKNGYIKFRTTKNGKIIGRKRQFIIDLKKYPNTLLFTRQGVLEGAIAFAPKEVEGCIATENMPMFSLKDRVSKKFVQLLLKSEQYISEIKKLVPTGSAQKSIHERDLMQIPVALPNQVEQEKFSAIIDNCLNSIQILDTEIQTQQTLLKKLRQSILQEAIEGKLTQDWRTKNPDIEPASVLLEKIKAEKTQLIKDKKIKQQKPLLPIKSDEIPFTIPDSWAWCRLNTLTSLLGDGLHGTPNYQKNQKCHFINGNNLNAGEIIFKSNTKTVSDDEYEKYKKNLNDRTILVSINGTLGNVAFYNNEYVILGKSACYFNLLTYIDKQYVRYIIDGEYYLGYAVRMSSKTTINNLSLKSMNLFLIPLPPLPEQKQIVKKIQSLFKICDALETQIKQSKTNSQNITQAVLKEAFAQNDRKSYEPGSYKKSSYKK